MSDALPRNITLIGRLRRVVANRSRHLLGILHESTGNRPFGQKHSSWRKEKAPLPGALISNGAAYRIPRIRCADPHQLRPPAGALARGLKTLRVFLTPAPRPRFESMRCLRKEKPPLPGL